MEVIRFLNQTLLIMATALPTVKQTFQYLHRPWCFQYQLHPSHAAYFNVKLTFVLLPADSVDRRAFASFLVNEAQRLYPTSISFHFGHQLVDVDIPEQQAVLRLAWQPAMQQLTAASNAIVSTDW